MTLFWAINTTFEDNGSLTCASSPFYTMARIPENNPPSPLLAQITPAHIKQLADELKWVLIEDHNECKRKIQAIHDRVEGMSLRLEKMESAVRLAKANWDTIDCQPLPVDPTNIRTSMAGTSGQWREWPKK
jgi:hypothetical protein